MYNVRKFYNFHDNDYFPNMNDWTEIEPTNAYMENNNEWIYRNYFKYLNKDKVHPFEWYLYSHLVSFNLAKKLKSLGFNYDVSNCKKKSCDGKYYFKLSENPDGTLKERKDCLFFIYELSEYLSLPDELHLSDEDNPWAEDVYNYQKQDKKCLCPTFYVMLKWLHKNNIFRYNIIQSPLDKTKYVIYYEIKKERKYIRTEDNDIEIDLSNEKTIDYIINIFVKNILKINNEI